MGEMYVRSFEIVYWATDLFNFDIIRYDLEGLI